MGRPRRVRSSRHHGPRRPLRESSPAHTQPDDSPIPGRRLSPWDHRLAARLSTSAVTEYLLAREWRLRFSAGSLICASQQSGSPPAAFLDVSSLDSAAPSGAAFFFGGTVRDGASVRLGFRSGTVGCGFLERGVDAGSNWRHKPPPADRRSCLTWSAKDANGADGFTGRCRTKYSAVLILLPSGKCSFFLQNCRGLLLRSAPLVIGRKAGSSGSDL